MILAPPTIWFRKRYASAAFAWTLRMRGRSESQLLNAWREALCGLERQPHRQLPNARRRASKCPCRRNFAEGRAIDVCRPIQDRRLRELRMIQRIEVFHAEFQANVLSDGGGLGQRHIKIRQMRSPQDIAGNTVRTVPRIVYRIQLGEAWVVALVVGVVLQRNVGKTVGIENEVASDGRSGCDLAVAARVAAVNGRDDRGQVPGVKRAYGCDKGSVGKIRIARAGSSGIGGINTTSQARRDIERETGAPGHDGINTPSLR